jgi:hypothetical protein
MIGHLAILPVSSQGDAPWIDNLEGACFRRFSPV